MKTFVNILFEATKERDLWYIEYNREQNCFHFLNIDEERREYIHDDWKILDIDPMSSEEATDCTEKISKIIDSGVDVIFRKSGELETDECPYCGDTHFHGYLPGTRSSHCILEGNKPSDKRYLILNYKNK